MHFNLYFSRVYSTAKLGIIKCMYSFYVSSQLLVSVLIIAIPTNHHGLSVRPLVWGKCDIPTIGEVYFGQASWNFPSIN